MTDEFDDDQVQAETPTFPDALEALQTYDDADNKSLMAIPYGLSDLSSEQIGELQPVWKQLHVDSRRKVMQMLSDVAETDFVLDYGTMGFFGLDDEDPGVREIAISILWIDESLKLMNRLIDMAANDEALVVRAAAAGALGRFILAGELEELSPDMGVTAQNAIIKIWEDDKEDISVRRRALEAISNCGHKIVPRAISEAYESGDQPMRVSAVFAMGCSYDNKRWSEIVLAEIDSDDAEIRYEAARSAGLLEIEAAIPKLGRMMIEEEREIVNVAVWSLGEIGGKEATRLLTLLSEKAEEDEDDDLMELIEDAIGNASFASDILDHIDDLDEYQ
jgi:hypothetical protein